jgi:predicted AAA+ superfamily ATPase
MAGKVLENWYQGYETTLIQKDVKELSDIEKLGYLPKLLRLTAGRVASTVNYSDLARSLEISNMSVKRYLELLKALYLIVEIPAWSGNYTKRLTKSSKIFFVDNGFLGYQLGLDKDYLIQRREVFGSMLENMVATEIIKQISWSNVRPKIFHFREVLGEEIDLILENRRGEMVAIEVKSSSRIKPEHLQNMKKFKAKMGDQVIKSILLYTGTQIELLGDGMIALPISRIFEGF